MRQPDHDEEPCPARIATRLRAAGWSGRNGFWRHPLYSGARRWWQAYYAIKTIPRKRRCRKTMEMFVLAHTTTAGESTALTGREGSVESLHAGA
jgi:hypothetical protein